MFNLLSTSDKAIVTSSARTNFTVNRAKLYESARPYRLYSNLIIKREHFSSKFIAGSNRGAAVVLLPSCNINVVTSGRITWRVPCCAEANEKSIKWVKDRPSSVGLSESRKQLFPLFPTCAYQFERNLHTCIHLRCDIRQTVKSRFADFIIFETNLCFVSFLSEIFQVKLKTEN